MYKILVYGITRNGKKEFIMKKNLKKFSASLLLGALIMCGTFGATIVNAASTSFKVGGNTVNCHLSNNSTNVQAVTQSTSSVSCGVQLSYQFYSTSSGSFDAVVNMPKKTGNAQANITKNYPSGKSCNYAYSVHYGNSKSKDLMVGTIR